MCNKPLRKKINLYSAENDISLFTMIQNLAKSALTLCQNDLCNKTKLAHTDFWYHNNGCIKIKMLIKDSQNP
jgi:hypothetical protein